MKTAIKILLMIIVLTILSWFMAIFWSSHGDWWLSHQTIFTKQFYFFVQSTLSQDIWKAEEQFDFWMFWIQSFIGLMLITIMAIIARKIIKNSQQK